MAIADTINSMYENVGEVYDTITNVDVNTGKNLFDNSLLNKEIAYQATASISNGVLTITSISSTGVSFARLLPTLTLLPNTQYTCSFDINGAFLQARIYDVDANNYTTITTSTSGSRVSGTFTTSSNTTYELVLYITLQQSCSFSKIQVEQGSIATEYEPYTDTPTYKNIENIPKVIRNSYLEIMNNGIDKIWNNWEKVEGTGESLSLNSTEEAPMKIDLKGNTSQEGTPTPETPQDIQVVSGDNTIKVEGKNLLTTLNASRTTKQTTLNVEDGIIHDTTNYTGTGEYSVAFSFTDVLASANYGNYAVPSGNRITLEAGTYTYSYKKVSGTAPTYDDGSRARTLGVFEVKDNTPYTSLVPSIRILGDTASITFTLTKTTTISLTYAYYFYGSNVSSDVYFTLQLEKGSTSTDYVKHIENVYPINLPVKNLFDSTQGENGYIDSSGNVVSRTYQFVSDYIPITSNNSYTISLNTIASNIGTAYFDSNKVYLTRSDQTNRKSHTFTPNTNWKYIRFWINIDGRTALNSTNVAETYNVQMEEGSKANSYTPYGTTPIELCKIGDYQDSIKKSTGKNLFDKDSISNGFLDESGIVGGDTSAYRTSDFIPILPNTAYYKTTTSSPRTKYYDKNKQPLNTTTYWDIPIGGNAGTFTTPSNAYYFRFSYPVTGVNANGIMINKGTTALDYEPYGKVWYLNKQTGKVVLNGSENITTTTYSAGAYFHNIINIGLNGTNNDYALSNYYTYSSSYMNNTCKTANRGKELVTRDNFDQSTYITWLGTNKPIFYYLLATPTYTEITDSSLINQLEAIKRSYNEQTNISQVNNDKPFILDVTALKQLT